jgi:hypothetical protein
MKGAHTSKILVIVYKIKRRHILDENNFHTYRLDGTKSHILKWI